MSDLQILHADARELAPEDCAGFASLICDPPYSEEVHTKATSANSQETGGVRSRDFGFAHLSDELRGALALAAQNVQRWSVIFSDFESLHTWRGAVECKGTRYVRLVPWVRWSQPQLSGDRPPSGAEAVLHFHRSTKPAWNGPGNLTHYDALCMRGASKHPTEKPLDLMLQLVSAYTDPGESVLDPTAGAGSTILAARLLDRGGVGLELDPEWARSAGNRVASRVLSARDDDRARRWVTATIAECEAVDRAVSEPAYDRAMRRLNDAKIVAKNIGMKL